MDQVASSAQMSGDRNSGVFRYRFANIEYDESTSILRVGGAEIPIEPLPLSLLSELLRRPNEVVTRAELFETVWEGRPTVDHVLANAVNKLRKALGEEGARRLVNVPRIGYRLVGPVERVAVGRQGVPAVALQPGEAVPGREGYKLRQPLGDASHSAVWLAFDSKLKASRVFKFAADGERLASLKREYTVYRVLRQELGERDDFARVLGANFSNAPYFLECEYGGLDLPGWATEHLPGLTQAERLLLFQQIAQAVASAHAIGVLHKDLKPANVLIATNANGWVARLTDFGSSRLLEPGRLAELGVTALGMTMTHGADTGLAGSTPLYVAPELLAGHSPTTGSDLYALGLILYQLLVGDFRRPMSTGWERDIDDALLRQDIIAATEGRPEDRLASVAEFAERLDTLPGRRAAEARRAQAAQHAEETARQLQQARTRRPWVAAVVTSLALGLAGSLWFYSQTRSALNRAEQESARAQAINDFLNQDVLQSADVTRTGTQRMVSMADVMKRASERAGERFAGQPRTEASVRRQLGETYLRMHYLAEADREFARAMAVLEPLVPQGDLELAAIRFGAAQSWTGREHPEEPLKRLEAAERGAPPQALQGDGSLALLASRTRVEVLMDGHRYKDALPAALRLLALVDRANPTDTAQRFEARQKLSEIYIRLGEDQKAKTLLTEIMSPPYNERSVGDVLFARAKLQLGRERMNQGDYLQAKRLLTEVRNTLTAAYGPNELHVGLANAELAELQICLGDFDSAAEDARAAITALQAALGENHTFVEISKANLSLIRLNQGQAARALRELELERPRIARLRDPATLLAGIDFGRAKAMIDLNRAADALALLGTIDPALLADGSWGPRDFQWQLQAEKGRALLALGRAEEGRELVASAVTSMRDADTHRWMLARYEALLAPARPAAFNAARTAQKNRP